MSTAAPNTPQKLGANFTLIEKLSEGGMAEVWVARQATAIGAQRPVVIKLIRPAIDSDHTRTMFLDEARTSMMLSHPNVVQVYDVDLDPETQTYYIAMELILGDHVGRLIGRLAKSKQTIPLPITLRIVADTCRGLQHAHECIGPDGSPMEIVHRDISPGNIMVSFEGHVKVVDFGIAQAKHRSTETQTGLVKGKYQYMSPEQARAQRVDRRTDVFALGAVLHEMCTGKRLFDAENDLAILDKIVSGEILPPSKISPGIPPELDAIVMRALERNLERRTRSVEALKEQLEELIALEGWAVTTDSVGELMRELLADRYERIQDARRRTLLLAAPKPAPELDREIAASELASTGVSFDETDLGSTWNPTSLPAPVPPRHRSRAPVVIGALAVALAMGIVGVARRTWPEASEEVSTPSIIDPPRWFIDPTLWSTDPTLWLMDPTLRDIDGTSLLLDPPLALPKTPLKVIPKPVPVAPPVKKTTLMIKVLSLKNPEEVLREMPVWIDGKRQTKTAPGRFSVAAGSRLVEIEVRGAREQRTVLVEGGTQKTINFMLDR